MNFLSLFPISYGSNQEKTYKILVIVRKGGGDLAVKPTFLLNLSMDMWLVVVVGGGSCRRPLSEVVFYKKKYVSLDLWTVSLF